MVKDKAVLRFIKKSIPLLALGIGLLVGLIAIKVNTEFRKKAANTSVTLSLLPATGDIQLGNTVLYDLIATFNGGSSTETLDYFRTQIEFDPSYLELPAANYIDTTSSGFDEIFRVDGPEISNGNGKIIIELGSKLHPGPSTNTAVTIAKIQFRGKALTPGTGFLPMTLTQSASQVVNNQSSTLSLTLQTGNYRVVPGVTITPTPYIHALFKNSSNQPVAQMIGSREFSSSFQQLGQGGIVSTSDYSSPVQFTNNTLYDSFGVSLFPVGSFPNQMSVIGVTPVPFDSDYVTNGSFTFGWKKWFTGVKEITFIVVPPSPTPTPTSDPNYTLIKCTNAYTSCDNFCKSQNRACGNTIYGQWGMQESEVGYPTQYGLCSQTTSPLGGPYKDQPLSYYCQTISNVYCSCSNALITQTPTPMPTSSVVCPRGELGNLDCSTDGSVDTSDFELFRQAYGHPVSSLTIPPGHHTPDLVQDNNAQVDTADYNIFYQNFGSHSP